MTQEWTDMALKPVRFPVDEIDPIERHLETTTVNAKQKEEEAEE